MLFSRGRFITASYEIIMNQTEQEKIEETEPTSTAAVSTTPLTEPITEATQPATDPTEVTEPTEITEPTGATNPSEDMTYPSQPSYLRLDYASLKMGVNETFTFTVETDAPSYTFRCFNDDVLTVDDRGTVTPHAPGNATVVCMTENGLSAVCQFRICPEATALTLNYGEKVKLGIGETIDFDSYVNSGAAACWRYYSSDNESVVKVERFGGIATAVGEGKANVTCTLENGVQARCEVTVEKLAQTLELNATAVTLAVGDKFDFDSYAKDGYAYFRNYHSLDESVASFARNDGIVTANKIGKTQIYCEILGGTRAYAEVTVVEEPDAIEVERASDTVQVGGILRVRVKGTEGGTVNNSFVKVSSDGELVTVAGSGEDHIDLKGMKLGTGDVTFTTQSGLSQTVKLTVEGSLALCIDVSTWQGAYIDFDKVKQSGIDYVILRAGYGNEASQIDNQFVNNYNKAKRAGLKVGAYWFSYATDSLDALNEVDRCVQVLLGLGADFLAKVVVHGDGRGHRDRDGLVLGIEDLLVLLCNLLDEVEVIGITHRRDGLEDLGRELARVQPLHEVGVGPALGTGSVDEGPAVGLDLLLVAPLSAHQRHQPRRGTSRRACAGTPRSARCR